MKILKNELFLPIITCFLALVSFVSLYSLPKAKANEEILHYASFDFLDVRTDIGYYDFVNYHYSTLNKDSTIDLSDKKIYFTGSLDYYVVLYLENFLELTVNFSSNTKFSLKLYDSDVDLLLDKEESDINSSYFGFCFDLPYDTLKIQNIKYFSKTTNKEVSSSNITIFVSNVDSTSFTYVEAVEPTYYSDGNSAYYKCSCHSGKYFDENYFILDNVTRKNLLAEKIVFQTYSEFPFASQFYVPLEKGVDLRGKNLLFSKDDSTLFTEIYFDEFYLRINSIFSVANIILFSNYSNFSLFIGPTNSSSNHMFARFCFDESLPDDFNFVVRDIKHFSKENIEIENVGYDILVAVFDVHNFSDWIDEIPATETTKGVQGHYTCSHCNKYFNENYVEISNLEIPIKTDKPNNGGFSGSGGSNGSSCSSASIYGIFGIAIVFSFVAFAISHFTKRKKLKRK